MTYYSNIFRHRTSLEAKTLGKGHVLSRGTIVPGVMQAPEPCLYALPHSRVAHSGHTLHPFLSLLSLQESHSFCRPGLVLVITQDIVTYIIQDSKNHAVYFALNSPQARETCLDQAWYLPPNHPVPLCQVRVLGTSWPAYIRAQ